MRHHGDRFSEWMWRRAETAAIAAAMGWTWIWMSRRHADVPIFRARLPRRRATRADEGYNVGYIAPEDRDGGAAWERTRRRGLVD